MQEYIISGMSCAACSAAVERAVSKVVGVEECYINLLLNSLTVIGNADVDTVIAAVNNAGYGAKLKNDGNFNNNKTSHNKTVIRLILSAVLLLLLMYISMGHVMWNFYLPHFLKVRPTLLGIIELIITTAIMIINRKFFISGAKSLVHFAPNMDSLVSLGSLAAYIYSVCLLVFMFKTNDITSAHEILHGLYFESSAMILTLISVGKFLEEISKGKTTNAISSLISLAPKTASVIVDGTEKTVLAESLSVGDIFVVKSGSSFPADGTVIKGSGTVDESSITGGVFPLRKTQAIALFAEPLTLKDIWNAVLCLSVMTRLFQKL